jgi:hypothetical protein
MCKIWHFFFMAYSNWLTTILNSISCYFQFSVCKHWFDFVFYFPFSYGMLVLCCTEWSMRNMTVWTLCIATAPTILQLLKKTWTAFSMPQCGILVWSLYHFVVSAEVHVIYQTGTVQYSLVSEPYQWWISMKVTKPRILNQ